MALTGTCSVRTSARTCRFSTKRDPENPSPYRVVVMFNPGPDERADGADQAPSQSRRAAATSSGRSIGARWPRPSITTNRAFGSVSTFPG